MKVYFIRNYVDFYIARIVEWHYLAVNNELFAHYDIVVDMEVLELDIFTTYQHFPSYWRIYPSVLFIMRVECRIYPPRLVTWGIVTYPFLFKYALYRRYLTLTEILTGYTRTHCLPCRRSDGYLHPLRIFIQTQFLVFLGFYFVVMFVMSFSDFK